MHLCKWTWTDPERPESSLTMHAVKCELDCHRTQLPDSVDNAIINSSGLPMILH